MNSNHYQLFTILIGFRTASPARTIRFFSEKLIGFSFFYYICIS